MVVHHSSLLPAIIVPDNVGVSASGELVWNQTDGTYTFKAKWTVPRTYNLPETITSFLFARLLPVGHHFFAIDANFKQEVPAVRHACKLLQSVIAYNKCVLQSQQGIIIINAHSIGT